MKSYMTLKILKFLRISPQKVCLFSLFSTITALTAFAAPEDLAVTDITRISHPAFEMSNRWKGTSNPWNKDYTKVLMLEASSFTHPDYGMAGRGLVWGNISELKSAAATGSLQDYINATHVLNNFSWCWGSCLNWGNSQQLLWSVLDGEEDVLYAIWQGTKVIREINVVTEESSIVGSYANDTGVTSPRLWGWTADNRIVFNYNGDNWNSGGFLLNVATGAKEYYGSRPDRCSQTGWNWPWDGFVHNARSPNKKFIAGYHAYANGAYGNDYTATPCGTPLEYPDGNFTPDWSDTPSLINHVNWTYSNDWFIGGTVGKPYNPKGNTAYLTKYPLYQVFFDNTNHTFSPHRLLLEKGGAGVYDGSGYSCNDAKQCGSSTQNYHSLPSPTMRGDGKQIIIQSSDDKYSYFDYTSQGKTPWGTVGIFLLDIAPASGGSDTQSPSVPANLVVTAVSENQIDLSWSSSTDNVGVAGYKIFRDGSQIAAMAGTAYSDTRLSPSTTYSYTVSSYDSAGNNSSQSNTISATTQSLPPSQPSYTILKAVDAPTIDGNLIEYSNASSVTFSPASGGNTVTVKALWDSQALYLGYEVTDTQLNGNTTTRDGGVWNDDSVEWFIDTLNNKGGSSNPGSSYMLSDDYHGIVNILNAQYDSQGTTSGSPSGFWNGAWQSVVKLAGTTNNNSDFDSKYFIEVKIPWASLGFAPTDDTVTGMSFAINDNDISSKSYLMWPDISTTFENASKWQNILLSGNSATPPSPETTPPSAPINLTVLE